MQQQIAMQAMLHGINDAFYVTVFLSAIALVLAFFIKRATQAEDTIGKKSPVKKQSAKLVNN